MFQRSGLGNSAGLGAKIFPDLCQKIFKKGLTFPFLYVIMGYVGKVFGGGWLFWLKLPYGKPTVALAVTSDFQLTARFL